MTIDIFHSLKNAAFDLQRADSQNYQHPLKKISRLLENADFEVLNADLTTGLDLQGFIDLSEQTESSMAGSAILQWPEEQEKCLGLTLLLIREMANDERFAVNFCLTFFHSRNILDSIRKFTSSCLIPFIRDYQLYIMNNQNPEPKVVPLKSRKIFIVHGHDNSSLQSVARFIYKIGLEEIILSERPDGSRTIIEKFEEESTDACFAIVLMTPDDIGSSVSSESNQTRARQNVLYELGYFVGKLGRGRVLVLKKGELEIPSDLSGVLYTELDDAGGWKRKVLIEMEHAGVEFDQSKALFA